MKLAVALLATPIVGFCSGIPPAAEKHLPVVVSVVKRFWPGLTIPSYVPAQIEQETCISLSHRKCWNPTTELKTDREYGFGLGQLTIAYSSSGKVRFDAWSEIKEKHEALRSWKWEDRYNPSLQIAALVIKNKINYDSSKFAVANDWERLAFVVSQYNGGSTFKDRLLCKNTRGCDPTRWFGNVEKYSYKSKVAVSGYGKSFFEINREYVSNVLLKRRKKYDNYFREKV